MSHRFPDRDANAGGAGTPPPKMLLNKRQVHVGESYSIKGDSHILEDLEDTVQAIAERKIRQAEADAQQIVALAKQEAERVGKQMLQEATEKADATANALIAQAQAQHDSVLSQARQDGFNAGFEQGYKEAVDKVEGETCGLLETAHIIVNGAYEAERNVLDRFQEDAMALVRHVAQKVIQTELQEPERLVSMVQSAADQLYLTGRVKVVLGQAYLEALRAFTPKTDAMMASLKRFEWTGDPVMGQHEIHILSADGAYAVGPEEQVAQLLEPLENRLPLGEPVVQKIAKPPAEMLEAPNAVDMAHADFIEENTESIEFGENELEADVLPPDDGLFEGDVIQNVQDVEKSIAEAELINGSSLLELENIAHAARHQPAVKPWALEDLDAVQEAFSEEASEPAPDETLPNATPVEFPDLESLLTEFGPQIDKEPDEDILS